MDGARHSAAKAVLRDLTSAGLIVEESGRADFEDGWEDAFRTHAGLVTFDPAHTWLRVINGGSDLGLIPLGDQRHHQSLESLQTEYPEVNLYGPEPTTVSFGHSRMGVDIPYWDYGAFRHHARRFVTTAGFAPDDPAAADIRALGIVRSGERFFVKTTASKRLPATAASLVDGRIEFDSWAWEWANVSMEGTAGSLLVQEFVPMRFEYRFFVIGARVVTGAGCIEEHTPFDRRAREQGRFDSRAREHRGPSATIDDPELVARLRDFALEVASDLDAESGEGELDAYTLDVGLGPDDEPLVIELNPIDVAGFYASDPYEIASHYRHTFLEE